MSPAGTFEKSHIGESISAYSERADLLPKCLELPGLTPNGHRAEPAFQLDLGCSRAPLPRKVLEFECFPEDRMTQRELIAFVVGVSASARRNKEKSVGSHHRQGRISSCSTRPRKDA